MRKATRPLPPANTGRTAKKALYAARIKAYTAALCRAHNSLFPDNAITRPQTEAIAQAILSQNAADSLPCKKAEPRIASLVNAYDALTTDNPPKRACTHLEACAILLRGGRGAFGFCAIEAFKLATDNFALIHDNSQNRKRMLQRAYSGGKGHYWVLKRLMDVALSALALFCLSPFMLLIAAAIWLDDPNASPIFRQVRLGRHKIPFVMYKFRSMVANAEALRDGLEAMNERDGPAFKIADDPRITRLGRFLRKTSLDELPQLVNVLKGDMSLVGPRPPLPGETAKYDGYQDVRLTVIPGLTCIWQAHPRRDLIAFDKWMDMDVDYIGRRSIRIDLKLILKTIWCVILGQGS